MVLLKWNCISVCSVLSKSVRLKYFLLVRYIFQLEDTNNLQCLCWRVLRYLFFGIASIDSYSKSNVPAL